MADSKSGSTTTSTDSKSGSGSTGALVGGVGGTLKGTSAIDTITYNMPFNSVAISHSADSNASAWKVDYSTSSSAGTTSGTDTLTDIERMSFLDGTHVALDVTQWQDSAGAALALCYAGFGKAPDAQTLGRWIYEADNYGASSSSSKSTSTATSTSAIDPQARIEQVAKAMLDYYAPNGADNASLVHVLFANVVGRAPAPEEQHTFTHLLEQGTYSQASLFALAAESSLNADHYIGLTGQGVAYTPYNTGSKAG